MQQMHLNWGPIMNEHICFFSAEIMFGLAQTVVQVRRLYMNMLKAPILRCFHYLIGKEIY